MTLQTAYLTDIDRAVADYLKSINKGYRVIYIGERSEGFNGEKWRHDQWRAEFDNDIDFPFSTGTGHRACWFTRSGLPAAKQESALLKELREITNFEGPYPQTRELRRNPNKSAFFFESYARALPPTSASVLYSLLLDADSGRNYTFNEFCDCFGYDSDSIRALKTYHACQDIAEKLDHLLTREQQAKLSELLEDY